MRRFFVTDIHGEAGKFVKCLEICGFDYKKDMLICGGDVIDRGPDSFWVVEELLKIKNLIAIRGNHDAEFLRQIEIGGDPSMNSHGFWTTFRSYAEAFQSDDDERAPTKIHLDMLKDIVPPDHIQFFKNQVNYYVTEDRKLFVHGGIPQDSTLEEIEELCPHIFYWDRTMWRESVKNRKYEGYIATMEYFEEIWIGHTPCLARERWPHGKIPKALNVYNLDTGSSMNGVLSIANIDTKELWQV